MLSRGFGLQPVRFGRFWVQPVGTTGSLVVLDVSRPEAPVIVDELTFGVDARPHWLALNPEEGAS